MNEWKYSDNRLRELRKGAGLTLEQVAVEIGRSTPTVAKLETGQMAFSIDYMIDLARVLNCIPSDFLPVSVNPNASQNERKESFLPISIAQAKRALSRSLAIPEKSITISISV